MTPEQREDLLDNIANLQLDYASFEDSEQAAFKYYRQDLEELEDNDLIRLYYEYNGELPKFNEEGLMED